MNGFIGSVKKFEPLADGTVTVMLSVSGEQMDAVVDAWRKSKTGERFCVTKEQMPLPGISDNRLMMLGNILHGIDALRLQVEAEFSKEVIAGLPPENEADSIESSENKYQKTLHDALKETGHISTS